MAGTAIASADLHAATGGNPFFATEVIAVGGRDLPPTIRDAVGAPVGRLSSDARQVLRAAAVLGARVERGLILAMIEDAGALAGLRECPVREMLEDHDGAISFRHELARRAVLDAIAAHERASLHRRALAALRSGLAEADSVRLAQHTIEAGDSPAIIELAPRAAEQASRLGAHGEAADYLSVALAFPGMTEVVRGEWLERYAYECSVSDRIAAAMSAQEAALAIWRDLGDRLREGNGLRAMSTFMWHSGEGDHARDVAQAAVDLLEPIAPFGRELAQAYGKLVLNSGQDDALARRSAARALDIANQISDEAVAVHSMTTLALAEINTAEMSAVGMLEDALQRAKAAHLADDTMRVLINLVETGHDLRRYDLADRYVDEALAFLDDHEFELYRHLLNVRIAQMGLERGHWDVAEAQARALLAGTAR